MSVVLHKIRKFLSECGSTLRQAGLLALAAFLAERAKNYAVRGLDLIKDNANALVSRMLAKITGKPLIYAIGNSHVDAFRGDWRFLVYPIGAATAHNLKNRDSATRANEQLFGIISNMGKKRDFAMLVFGEIDCRVHFYNQFMKNNKKIPLRKFMESTLRNYGEVLLELKKQGCRLIVHGIPPASTQQNIYKFPFYAPPETRAKINQEFNALLRAFCKKNSIPYFDVYPLVVDGGGFTKKEYTADEVHLNGKIKMLFWNWAGKEFKDLKR